MAELKNESEKYIGLINDIEKGQLKIPQFQRKFIWDKKRSAKLIDSLLKGYPIGTFIFWRTSERLRSIRNLGDVALPEPVEGEFVNYVLDGQQRITSIYAALKELIIMREDGRSEDYSRIYVNLEASDNDQLVISDVAEKEENTYIKVVDLISSTFTALAQYPQKFHDKLEKFRTRFTGFDFSVVSLKDATIDVATEVFTRLNVGGKALTLFEIMVAKTYDYDRNFDLSSRYDELMQDLATVKFETISEATVLQVVSMLIQRICTRKQILMLNKDDVIDIWDDAVDAIKASIDYFRSYFGISVSMLLPYNALIVPFSYYFYKSKKKPTGNRQKYLEDFFWRASLGNRYSSGVEGKLANDVERIDQIIKGRLPKYEWLIDITPDYIITNGWFSTGRSFIKAILTVFTANNPRSFDDNSQVNVDNSWLKISTSKNYHHFFPKAYMKKHQSQIDYWDVNNVVNITIVDDFLNKRKIKDKPPSVYMQSFDKGNPDIAKTMRTHLIGDFKKFGIIDNDFMRFMQKRAQWISRHLKSRIVMQDSDFSREGISYEEYEQQEEDEYL